MFNKGTTLVIMAAGIGSRFGGGTKQLEAVGPNGELIMDYSIRDAIEAGFTNVVFILRKEIEQEFRELIGDRIAAELGKNYVTYVFQEMDKLPESVDKEKLLRDRKKPWGTGQAVLACKEVVHTPFLVINADDYYGKEAFVKMHHYLLEQTETKYSYCMAGFILKNTLSEVGGVTRGICRVSEDGYLTKIVETKNICKTEDGAAANGIPVDIDSHVSMNMWGLTPDFFEILETGFTDFLNGIEEGDCGTEYLLPTIIGDLLSKDQVKVRVLESSDRWFGVTYKEDKAFVREQIQLLFA